MVKQFYFKQFDLRWVSWHMNHCRSFNAESFLYTYIHHHHHHVVALAWISLTLSRHFSLSFIASGRSSGLHSVSSHSSSRFVSVHVVHPYSSIDTTAAWKKLRFILSVRSDFHMIDSLLMAVHILNICFLKTFCR